MGKIMSNIEFANIAKETATKYKTLYIMGCFGSPMNSINKTRYCKNHPYNQQSTRATKIQNASADTFGFDCICLIKGILWGWNGNINTTYGGASYKANGVPDVGADDIMNYCTDVSTNFSNIQVGELVHMSGHIGIYIGDGLAVECTPIWKDGVQITAVGNIGAKSGYNKRTWFNHGKLNFIEYNQTVVNPSQEPTPTALKYKIGDKVVINGGLYYSPSDTDPLNVVQGVVTFITRTAPGTKHPYNTTGDLGWMNEADIQLYNETKIPLKYKIGDKVTINGGLYYNPNDAKPLNIVQNVVTYITRTAPGTKHPYNTTGDLGWMNESDIQLYK